MSQISKLEQIASLLGPNASSLFRSAVLLSSKMSHDQDLLSERHTKLKRMAAGHLYYTLASSIITELEKDLVFTQPFPFPAYSHRIGTDNQDLAFLEGGPIICMAFPGWSSPGEIQVDFHLKSKAYVTEEKLSKRMHVNTIVVDCLESFNEFLKKGVKGFREANPFVPLDGDFQKGDLVYCVEYGRHPKSERVVVPELGNILEPDERLGVVSEIEEREGKIWYKIETISKNKKNFDYRKKQKDEVSSRCGTIDELFLVRHVGWTEDDLKSPFMTNKEAEEIIWPILLKYGEDPRLYSAHIEKYDLLSQQFRALLTEGVDPSEIVDTLIEDYGLSQEQVLRLAGVDKEQLSAWVNPKLERIVSEVGVYGSNVSQIIAETARIMGMTPEELIAPITVKSGIEIDDRYTLLYQRKVRAKTYHGTEVIGYVSEIFPPHDVGEDFVVNVFDDMTNPLSKQSVGAETVEILGLEAYRYAETQFEFENVYYFLVQQARSYAQQRSELKERAAEAEEFLDEKLNETRLGNVKKIRSSRTRHVDGDDEDNPVEQVSVSDAYDSTKNRLDENVVGPLLSFGLSEKEVRDSVLAKSNNPPFVARALDDIFRYRNRRISNPFERPGPRKMLAELVDSGLHGYEEVISFMEMWTASQEYREDHEAMLEATKMILLSSMNEDSGEPFTPLAEFMEVQTTGKERKYLQPHDVQNIIRRFIEQGKPSPKAIEDAARGTRHDYKVGRAFVVKRQEDTDTMFLKITSTEVDTKKCAVILLDEIVNLNRDDPRNRQYLSQRALIRDTDIIKGGQGLFVFPLSSSGYMIHLSMSEDYRNERQVSIVTANIQPASLCLGEKPTDLSESLRIIRESGFNIKLEGHHKIQQSDDGKYVLVPEWEIPYTGNEHTLFSLGIQERSRSSRSERSRFFRDLEEAEDRMHFETGYAYIYAFECGYFGIRRSEELLAAVGRRIEQEFGLQSKTLLQYADQVSRIALPSLSRPLLTE